jgi:hypothetical protein
MPYTPYNIIKPKVNQLLEGLQGMTLKSAQIVENGFTFIYEGDEQRLVIHLLPTVYTQGKNIVDPINDMTLLMEVHRLPRQGEEAGELLGSVEMAFSTWLGEDFL